MAESYKNIRKALALLDSVDVYERALGHATLRDQCHPDTIRALLAERDALAAVKARVADLAAWLKSGNDVPADLPFVFRERWKKIAADIRALEAAIAAANGGGNG